MQLIAGRTAQEYNWRKNRKGAYWEDRYHATAIEKEDHLYRCIAYIDLNMVRVGVVSHPSDWQFGGYNEIQNHRERYAIINYQRLMDLLGIQTLEDLKKSHSGWVEEALANDGYDRESQWTESVAVGGKGFIEAIKKALGFQVKGRDVIGVGESYQLREQQSAYSPLLGHEKNDLSDDNTYFWDVSHVI